MLHSVRRAATARQALRRRHLQPCYPPDFAMQFNICLPLPIPGYIVGTLQSAIVKALIQLDLKSNDSAPNPDIQQQCINGKHVVAAWFAPPFGYGNWDSPAARAKTIS